MDGTASKCAADLAAPPPPPNRSNLAAFLVKGEEEAAVNGGAGIPVNSWTMARKLVVSVVNTVVGARREALGLFFELRATLAPPPQLLGIFCNSDWWVGWKELVASDG